MTSPEEPTPDETMAGVLSRATDLAKTALGGNISADDTDVIPSGTLTDEAFVAWAKEKGFTNGKRGTYSNGESFLYVKQCHHLEAEQDVEPALAAVRELTSKGALHPDTKWGVVKPKDDVGGYQLFAVSPKLEAWSLEHIGTEQEKYGRLINQPLAKEGSIRLDWCRRVDPNYEPDQPLPDNSLLKLLNLHEASHPDNWGWDETGKLYPVDVEVINIHHNMDAVKTWYASQMPEPLTA